MIQALQLPSRLLNYTDQLQESVKKVLSIIDQLAFKVLKKPLLTSFFAHQRLSATELYLKDCKNIVWDQKNGTFFCPHLHEKIAIIFLNALNLIVYGKKRFYSSPHLVFLNMLSSINLESSHLESHFLTQGFELKKKLQKEIVQSDALEERHFKSQLIEKIEFIFKRFNQLTHIHKQMIFPGFAPHLLQDRSFILSELRQNGLLLRFLEGLQGDKEIVKTAYIQNPLSAFYINGSLKNNKTFVLELLEESTQIYDYLSEPLKSDRTIILKLVSKNGKLLPSLKEEFRHDPQIVLQALKSPHFDLRVAASFTADREIMLEAYRKNAPLKMIDEALKSDKQFTIDAIKIRGWDVYTRCCPDLKKDLEVKVTAYKKRFMKKRIFDDQIKLLKKEIPQIFDDEEFIMFLISQNAHLFKHASKRLKKVQAIILHAVSHLPSILADVDPALRSNKDFILQAVSCRGEAINFASIELANDKEVAKAALLQDKYNFHFIGHRLQKDSEFLKEILLEMPTCINHINTDHLEHVDAREVLKRHGWLYSKMSLVTRQCSECIKAAFSSSPLIVYQIPEQILLNLPELQQFLILSKLEKQQFTIGQEIYLPKSIASKTQKEIVFPEEQLKSWQELMEDLERFIESWNEQTCLTLLNFSPPSKQARESLEVQRKFIEDKKRVFQAALNQARERIDNKTPFLGTPKEADREGLELFYETIKYHLSRLASVLIHDASLKKERLQILESFTVCGGGLLGQLHELDLQFYRHQTETLEETLIYKLKQIALSKLGRMNFSGDVHTANTLKWTLADYLGGKKIILDHLADHVDPQKVLINFHRMFNAKSITGELLQDVHNQAEFRELFLDYIEESFIPYLATSERTRQFMLMQKLLILTQISELSMHKERLYEQLALLGDLELDQKIKAHDILYRAGSLETIAKTLSMTVLALTPSDIVKKFLDSKILYQNCHDYFVNLTYNLGLSKKRLIDSSEKDLRDLYENPDDHLLSIWARKTYEQFFLDQEGMINPHGIAEVLTHVDLFDKVYSIV